MAGEPEVRQRPDVWKKIVIIGGAVLGGLAASRFAGPHGSVFEIIIGVLLGAFVAKWVWDFADEESRDQESCGQKSDRGKY